MYTYKTLIKSLCSRGVFCNPITENNLINFNKKEIKTMREQNRNQYATLNIREEIIDKLLDCDISIYELNNQSTREIMPKTNLTLDEAKELYGALLELVYKEETIPGYYCKASSLKRCKLTDEEVVEFYNFIINLSELPEMYVREFLKTYNINSFEKIANVPQIFYNEYFDDKAKVDKVKEYLKVMVESGPVTPSERRREWANEMVLKTIKKNGSSDGFMSGIESMANPV